MKTRILALLPIWLLLFVASAHSTTYTKYVNPNSTGGDGTTTALSGAHAAYASIQAWSTAEKALYSSGDTGVAGCSQDGGAAVDNYFNTSGWTIGVIPIIRGHARPTHNGTTWVGYVVTDGAHTNVSLYTANMIIDGLIIRPTSNQYGISNGGLPNGSNAYIKNTVIDGGGTNTGIGIHNYYPANIYVHNTLVIGFNGTNANGIATNDASGSIHVYNSTFYNCYHGMTRYGGTVEMINTIVMGGGSTAYNGTCAGASDYNISNDTTACGTNTLKSKTTYASYFVDTATGNFHLLGTTANGGVFGATGLAGNSLSGTFTDDLDGDTRSAWDIGFDEYSIPTVPNPTFTYGTGTYNNTVSEILSDTDGSATICYTTDGATPAATTAGTCDSDGHTQTYSTAISVTATATAIKALATRSGYTNSSVVTATYTLTVATPSYDHDAGTYYPSTSVTITDSTTSGAIVYCTDTDNTCTPVTSYSTPVTVSVTGTYLRSKATKSSYNDSAVKSALYTISNVPNTSRRLLMGVGR